MRAIKVVLFGGIVGVCVYIWRETKKIEAKIDEMIGQTGPPKRRHK